MKTIKANNCELQILVDDEDFERLSTFNWIVEQGRHQTVRRRLKPNEVGYKTYGSVRVTITNSIFNTSGVMYDHKDGNPLNNQKLNLRPATEHQNRCNSGLRSDNSTGYKGVVFDKLTSKFRATIRVKGKRIHLGSYTTVGEAAMAYNDGARKYHKDFAYLNPS